MSYYFSYNGSIRGGPTRRANSNVYDIADNAPNDPQNEEVQDHREADSYLNMSGDGIEGEEEAIAQASNDGQQFEV